MVPDTAIRSIDPYCYNINNENNNNDACVSGGSNVSVNALDDKSQVDSTGVTKYPPSQATVSVMAPVSK